MMHMHNIKSETSKIIREILNKHDPMGLIAIGCPVNEYDPEVSRIVQINPIALNVQEFGLKIYEVFVVMFSKENAGDKVIYVSIANDIKDSIDNMCKRIKSKRDLEKIRF